MLLRRFQPGDRVVVRGKGATFVKAWGAGAVIRYDDAPRDPKVVPLERVEPAGAGTGGDASNCASGGAAH